MTDNLKINEPKEAINFLTKEITLRCSQAHAFKTFTQGIDVWWPKTHRKFTESTLQLEPFETGRFVETSAQGEIFVLGEVLSCKPPEHIRYSWYPGANHLPTTVDIAFIAVSDCTQVRVIHYEGAAKADGIWGNRVALFEKSWNTVLAALEATIK